MIANGWKTSKQIREDYDLNPNQFKVLRDECLNSTYAKAIIIVASKTYVVDEDLWQEFLISKDQRMVKAESDDMHCVSDADLRDRPYKVIASHA